MKGHSRLLLILILKKDSFLPNGDTLGDTLYSRLTPIAHTTFWASKFELWAGIISTFEMGVENAICQAMFVFPAQPNYSARVKETQKGNICVLCFETQVCLARPTVGWLGAIPRRIIPVKKSALPTYKGQYTFSAENLIL